MLTRTTAARSSGGRSSSASTSSTPPTCTRSARARRSLGRALRDFAPRDRWSSPPRCSSRWATGRTSAACRASTSAQAIDASLRRLGTDYIDLYQIHRFDPRRRSRRRWRRSHDVVRAARRATSARRPCTPGSSRRCSTCADGTAGRRFVSMQNHYNLVYREEEREMIPLCLRRGHRRHPVEPARPRLPGRQPPRARTGRHGARQDRRLRAQSSTSATPTSRWRERVVGGRARQRGVKPHAGRARLAAGEARGHGADRRRDAAGASRRRRRRRWTSA